MLRFKVFESHSFKGGIPDLGWNALLRAYWKHWAWHANREGQKELTELSPRNSARASNLTDLGG